MAFKKMSFNFSQPLERTAMITHIGIVLYAMSFWIQMGALPVITNKLNVDSITFGTLQTAFGVAQLIGGPLFGRFGDLYGSQTAFALSFVSALFSYIILGLADTLLILFLSRLCSVFMHSMQGAQMIITDISTPAQRSAWLGKTSISYGIGMMLGPTLGGLCISYKGERFSAFVAAGMCAIGLLLVRNFIPVQIKEMPHLKVYSAESSASSETNTADASSSHFFNSKLFLSLVWKNEAARKLFLTKLISGIPIGVLHSMFSIILLNHLQVSPQVNGLVLSYIGVLSMFTQGYLVGKLASSGYNDSTLIKFCVLVLSVTYLSMSLFVNTIIKFCIHLFPLVIAGSIFNSLVQGNLTKTVSHEHTGSILGFSMAINSFMRSISPTVGGAMFQLYGFKSFGLLGGFCNGLLYFMLNSSLFLSL